MDIKANTQLTNSFAGGMNTDLSDMLIKSEQYRLAKNVRYVTNDEENGGELRMIDGCVFGGSLLYGFSILGAVDKTSGEQIESESITDIIKVLYTGSIRLFAVAIVKATSVQDKIIYIQDPSGTVSTMNDSSCWWVLVSKNPFDGVDNDEYKEMDAFKVAFGPCGETLGDKLSVVCRYENYNNVHVYVADGINPVFSINIGCVYEEGFKPSNDYNSITSTPVVTFERILFNGLTTGSLPGGVVEYSYQYYNKYGNESKISPPTKLIPIIKGSGDKTEGYNIGDKSDRGVILQMPGKHKSFDSMRIYRICYIESGLLPTIDVVYESNVETTDSWTFTDAGQLALYNVTLEEYNANSGIHIIPKVIESKEDYLFAANIKKDIDSFVSLDVLNWDARAYRFKKDGTVDLYTYGTDDYITVTTNTVSSVPSNHDCWQQINDINKDVDLSDYNDYGEGVNISWYFETMTLVGDSNEIATDANYIGSVDKAIGSFGEPISYNELKEVYDYNMWGTVHVRNPHSVATQIGGRKATYADPVVSYTCRSLRRDELYRFGIVLYDKLGNASPVKWIADIRTPNILDCPTFKAHTSERDLLVYPLGITFEINYESLSKIGITSYEIVRCRRTEKDIKNLSQGVLSRPIRREVNKYNLSVSAMLASYPYTPSGWLTTSDYWAGSSRIFEIQDRSNDDEKQWWSESNARLPYIDMGKTYYNEANTSVFLFVSPEICYEQDLFKQVLLQQTIKLKLNTYLYGYGTRTSAADHAENSNVLLQSTVREVNQPWTYSNIFANQVLYPGNKYTKMYVENTGMYFYLVESSALQGVVVTSHFAEYQDDLKNVLTCTSYIAPLFYYGDTLLHKCVTGSGAKTTISGKEYVAYSMNDSALYGNSNTVYSENDTDYRHQYIKLYQQSDDIIGVPKLVGMPVGGASVLTSPKNVNAIDVEDFSFADTKSWDDFAEVEKSGETYPLKYVNQQVLIGQNSFVNWVSNGAYNVPATGDWSTLKLDDEGTLKYMMGLTNVVMGPGGACMLLSLLNAPTHIITSVAARTTNTNFVGTPAGTFGTYTVVPESRLGTFLCNITHTISPYSGFTYESRKQDIYYSCGDYFKLNSELDKTDASWNMVSVARTMSGDCYIQPMEYVSLHKYYFAPNKYTKNACIIYAIPVESSINLAFTSGAEYRRTRSAEIQETPSDVYRKYTQSKSLYKYNPVYSAGNDVNPKSTLLDNDDYDVEFDTRCFYSNVKSNNEKSDSWLKFMPANFIDVDTRKGPITNLRTFNNQLVFWLTDGTGIFSVNEKASVTQEQTNTPLILGTGGVLSRFDYFNTVCGMKENEFCDAQSDSTLFWWDHIRKELCAYTGGLEVLSLSKSKSVQNLINVKAKQNLLANDPHLIYDKKYNELIAYIATTDTPVTQSVLLYDQNIQIKHYSIEVPMSESGVDLPISSTVLDTSAEYYGAKTVDNFKVIVSGVDNIIFNAAGGNLYVYSDWDYPPFLDVMKDNLKSVLLDASGEKSGVLHADPVTPIEYKPEWYDSSTKIIISFDYLVASDEEQPDVKPDNPSADVTKRQDGSLLYSELTGTFLSLADVYPKHHIAFGDKIYMLSDKDENQLFLWLWNYQECKKDPSVSYVRGFSNILYPYIKYVVNDNATLPKVFDNVSFGGRFYGGDTDTKDPYTGNITTIDGGIKDIVFEFSTPLKQHGKLTGNKIENREYDFRFSIPRNNDSEYGDRLRGKTILCEMYSNKSDVDFSLLYITTKYRISWA